VLSARARWIAGLVAVVAIGVLASIPAFLDRSGSREARVVRYAWLDQVPVSRDTALPDPSTPIGSAPDGQRLLATRIPDGEVCMRFGDSGRQCVSVDTEKQIQLVAWVRGRDENVLWGVLADDVAAIRVRRGGGSVFPRNVRRAFGVLEVPGEKVVSITALDDHGAPLGKVSADGSIPVSCALKSCGTADVSFDDAAP
jgi:hypothetical protein